MFRLIVYSPAKDRLLVCTEAIKTKTMHQAAGGVARLVKEGHYIAEKVEGLIPASKKWIIQNKLWIEGLIS